jgi:hypothetical protein
MAEFPVQMVAGSTLNLSLHTRWGPIDVDAKVVWTAVIEDKVRHGVAFPEPKDQDFALGLFTAAGSGRGSGIGEWHA